MLKIKNITIILITLFLLIVFTSPSIFGATITQVQYSNSKITVLGTCTTSNQVQVIVFDLNKQPMYLATVEVNNNTFNKTLDASFNLEEGKTYIVKISDYNGTGVSTETFIAEEVDPNEKDETPKTGTIEYIVIATLIITISVFGITIFKKKKHNKE